MNRLCQAVVGKSQTGKSYLVKNEIIPLLKKEKPVVIFDWEGEYSGRTKPQDLPERWVTYNGVLDFFEEHIEEPVLKGVNVIESEEPIDYSLGLSFLNQIKHNLDEGIYVIVDEGQFIFMDRHFREAELNLTKLVRAGGKHGIDFILISQRSKDIPPKIRSQFNSCISFCQTSDYDLQAINDFGFDNTDKVANLKDREFIIFGELPRSLNKLKEKSNYEYS